jgi:hypothetical protein
MTTTQADEAKALETMPSLYGTPNTSAYIRSNEAVAFWYSRNYLTIRSALQDTADLRTQLAERDAQLTAVCAAGQEVVNRWDSPSWKWDDEHTGHKIHRLRDAITATRQPTQDKE